MRRFVVPAVLVCSAALHAQTAFFPLKDINAGLRGTGRTVFSGNQIEEFQVEILGVLENIGPKQSLILARLSGGPLEQTGVMQGMSGSPVYIDGKLVGAVAMAFPVRQGPDRRHPADRGYGPRRLATRAAAPAPPRSPSRSPTTRPDARSSRSRTRSRPATPA